MKMNKYSIFKWFSVALLAFPLMSVGSCWNKAAGGDNHNSGEELTEGLSSDGSSGNELADEEEISPSSGPGFVDISITRCERVGNVLQIDYTVKNNNSYNMTLEIPETKVTDNNGTSYGRVEAAFGNNMFTNFSVDANIAGGSTVIGHAKVQDFDPTNKAKSVNLELQLKIEGESTDDNIFQKSNITVVDNRVMAHGIQTNDLNLQWKLNSCRRDSGGNVFIEFTLKNNTGSKLDGFRIADPICSVLYDNLGTKFNDWGVRWGTSGRYEREAYTNIAIDGTVMGSIKIEKVSSSATEVSADLTVDVRDYVMNDNKVRFLTIPIK